MHGKRRRLESGTYQRRYVCCGVDNSGGRLGCGWSIATPMPSTPS